jgi:hypothetical protein
MATPSNTTTGWVDILIKIAVPVGTGIAYLFGLANGRGKRAAEMDSLVSDMKVVKAEQKTTREILTQHTTLHQGYVQMAADVRGTRDCVNRIAGHLGIDGTS